MDLRLKGKVALVTGSSSLLKRFASTDEVAALVTFIASPLSSATNGTALRVDGGVVRSIL